MILIAIDPAVCKSNVKSGSKAKVTASGLGIASFYEGKLTANRFINPIPKDEWTFPIACREIVQAIRNLHVRGSGVEVVVETNRYQGISNIYHLKLLGVLDYEFGIETIHAMTVKKLVTGNGQADKEQVKQTLIDKYPDRDDIIWDKEDAVDSIAIGLAYLKQEEDNG